MEQVVEKSALSDIEKVRAFVEFSRKNPYYNNALEKLNMGENSISQLLAWLLDTNWVNDNDIEENQLHRIFTYEFLKLIKNQETESDKSILQEYNDTKLNELAYGIVAEQDKDNIDILLVNEDMKFVCVIENKKRAKLSTSKIKDERRILQIEKYCNYIDENYADYNKKFVYLCAERDDLSKTIEDRIVDIGIVPECIKNNLIFEDKKYNDFKDNKISWALEKLNYTILEHSQVVLILYNILRNIDKQAFDNNGILNPLKQEQMECLSKSLLEFFTKEYTLKKNKIPANAKMRFYDRLSDKFSYEQRLNLLCQFVEYWELHSGVKDLSDNLLGYSKIVDGEYIYDICKNLKNGHQKWEECLELAQNSEKFQELINYL